MLYLRALPYFRGRRDCQGIREAQVVKLGPGPLVNQSLAKYGHLADHDPRSLQHEAIHEAAIRRCCKRGSTIKDQRMITIKSTYPKNSCGRIFPKRHLSTTAEI